MANNDDTLFREVEEELARERWEKLWQQYGTYMLAGAALIVAVVGGKQYWDSHQRSVAEKASADYEAAVALAAGGKTADAEAAFSRLAASGPKGYATLADLNLAGGYVKAGKKAEALAIYDKLAKASPDPILAGFAQLQGAALKLGDADFTEMQNRLAGLTEDRSPWRIAAKELLGHAALKAGKLEEAKTALNSILGDPATSREAAARVTMLLQVIAASELASKSGADASGAAAAPAEGSAPSPAPAAAAPAEPPATAAPASADNAGTPATPPAPQ